MILPILGVLLLASSVGASEYTKRKSRRLARLQPVPVHRFEAPGAQASDALAAAVAPTQPPKFRPAVQTGSVLFAVEDETPSTIFREALPLA
jgi:hypothetical protein